MTNFLNGVRLRQKAVVNDSDGTSPTDKSGSSKVTKGSLLLPSKSSVFQRRLRRVLDNLKRVIKIKNTNLFPLNVGPTSSHQFDLCEMIFQANGTKCKYWRLEQQHSTWDGCLSILELALQTN